MPERVKKLRDFFGLPKREDFSSWSTFVRSPVATWLSILVFAMVAAFVTTFSVQRIPKTIEEGAIATRDIKADRNYEIVDQESTNKLKQEATEQVLPVYNFDGSTAQGVSARIHEAFDKMRSRLAVQQTKEKKRAEISEGEIRELKEEFAEILGADISNEHFSALLKENLSQRVEQTLASVLIPKLMQPIVAEKGTLAAERERGITLRYVRPDGEQVIIDKESTVTDPSQIATTEDVRQRIAKMTIQRERFRTPEAAAAIISIAQALVVPNVGLDIEETNSRREAAESGVQNVTIRIKAGEMIIRNGSRYEARHIKILSGISRENGRGIYPLEFLGSVLFIVLLIVLIYYFSERYIRRFHPVRRDYTLMAVLALANLIVMRIGFSTVPVAHEVMFVEIPISALIYAVPVASGAMLLRMFLHAEDAFIFAVLISLLSSLFAETDLPFAVFCFISNVVGITAIANTDKRSAIIRAGVITGAIGAVAVLGIKLVGMVAVTGQIVFADVVWHMVSAFFGGLWCAILIMILAPLVESLLGYTSDIKLLELANLNHPLLRELIVRAPGTYHHSHLVGILAEAAAEAIGANPLLVRVGAYYHDIGKIRKPLYFVENSKEGDDRHLKLSPHMSALIVSSHVKEGMEMGEEAGLPRSIINMIPQHHGTRLISFFFEKAKQQAGDENIKEEDFHYPGPKPQSREAAILMLADIAEASVRSLKEKGPARMQQTVQRVINDCFADEQLSECELTLHDLNEIARAFLHILYGIYHQRIEYPKDQRPPAEVSVVDEESFAERSVPSPSPKEASGTRARSKGAS